jgi:hypothetical protein
MVAPLRRSSRQSNSALPLLLGLVAFLLWIVAMMRANDLAMNSYGLVSVLGWQYFLGLILLTVGLTMELVRSRLRPGRLIFLVVIFVFFIYGSACAIEPVAGLQAGFVHAGFILYILQHGHPLNDYDARFSWPAGFSLGAVLVSFAGLSNALAFMRWFPLIIELMYLAPLVVIARFSGVGKRAAWLGIILYYANNWIYQDYLSPQALNYLFFLVIIAGVFAIWQPAAEKDNSLRNIVYRYFARVRALLSRSRWEGSDTTTEWPASRVLSVLALLALIGLASAMSHQLTPYALLLALVACLFTRRLGRPELVVVMFLFAVGWLSLGASDYWIGHLKEIFGGVGQLSGTVGANVTKRVIGSASHRQIVDARILEILALYGLGVIGALRRRPDSRAIEALAAAPLVLLVAQSYGGEGLLRAVLFGLPFVSLLAASAILPNRVGPIRALVPWIPFRHAGRKVLGVCIAVTILFFGLVTVVVRGGNDAYESWTNGEFAAVNYTYNHMTQGETLGLANPYTPFGYRDVGLVYVYVAATERAVPRTGVSPKSFVKHDAAWVILSQSQESWGVNVAGYRASWEQNLESSLLEEGYKIMKVWPTSTVLHAPSSVFVKKE